MKEYWDLYVLPHIILALISLGLEICFIRANGPGCIFSDQLSSSGGTIIWLGIPHLGASPSATLRLAMLDSGGPVPKSTFSHIPPEKQERVLRTAALLFAERGFNQADMAELATRAGVSKGSLYTYFESKEDLYLYVCREGMSRARQEIYSQFCEEWDLAYKLEYIMRRGMAFAQDNPEYVALYINLASAGMDQFSRQLSRDVEHFAADKLKAMLRQAVERGQACPDLDVDLIAFLINSLYLVLMASLVSSHFKIRAREYMGISGPNAGQDLGDRVAAILRLLHRLLNPPFGGSFPEACLG